jgi:ribosomal protein S18 acetylase RimI-like enzyme
MVSTLEAPPPATAPPSSLSIRLATDADMAFFHEMEFETTWHSLSPREQELFAPEQVRESLAATLDTLLARPGNAIFIAEAESGERLGVLWFGVNRNPLTGEDEAWIYNISVVPHGRRQGVGARLMAHAEAHARRGGFRTLGLMVSAHNDPARRLYARHGFEEANVIMRRTLSPP